LVYILELKNSRKMLLYERRAETFSLITAQKLDMLW